MIRTHRHTKEMQLQINEKLRGRHISKKTRLRMSRAQLIAQNRPEVKQVKREKALAHKNKHFKNTSIELKMKKLLELQNIEYIFQHPLEKIGIVDFYIPSKKLIIECDGCYWHKCSTCHPLRATTKSTRDAIKTKKFRALGYTVLRFWEHDIKRMKKVWFL